MSRAPVHPPAVHTPAPPLPARPIPPARDVPAFPPLRVGRGRYGLCRRLRLPGRRTAAAGLAVVAAALYATGDPGNGSPDRACRSAIEPKDVTFGEHVPNET